MTDAPREPPRQAVSATLRRAAAHLTGGTAVLTATATAVLLAGCSTPSDSGSREAGWERGGAPPATDTGLGWGFTHTQRSADGNDPEERKAIVDELSVQPLPQVQAIMGWGAGNPEPSPGDYDFESLDSRISLIRRTGGTPVITLCCAPDWMKGGKAGRTDWSRIEEAPSPEHYDDFAALSARIAERYPDVRHFVVWNELKGFWNRDEGRWDYEGYTRLYNAVHKAVKKADRRNLVGGPYLGMDSVPPGQSHHASAVRGPWGSLDQRVVDALDYWLAHRTGADFLAVDGSSAARDDSLSPDRFAATEKFSDVGRWLHERSSLPLWWSEWYVTPSDAGWREDEHTAVQATAMMEIARGDPAAAFYWNPQQAGGRCTGCLWRNGPAPGDEVARPMLELLRGFAAAFPPGTEFATLWADDARVRVLGDADTVLAVNTSGRALRAEVDGEPVDFGPYEVTWLQR
ncbi:xylan 1,4-beta-xylosidase [Streptomyces sp. DSM 42041]|uniref:Xylan 1,4-beta-xylosidase n=1 Tax=Streptomyces hazeniae TaxID=3075538 RepID=A0ABU2NP45_9ACTN|nr:xylan 1,4-beta-xylosidase [Streptomyces sp. DSM 42041]MDT0378529.1 xylan 1,4-beta-xylosidase [Streptomyces sp. DSM 42041]